MPTGYVWEEIYGWHNTGNSAGAHPAGLNAQPYEHFESAASKIRLASAIEVSGLIKNLTRIRAHQASVEDIALVHPKEYIDRIKRDSATPVGGDAGDETGSSSVKNDQSFTSLESFSITYKIDSCFDSKTL
jgi:acetoin utilization deacetylase AcuC-like enzyme